MLYTTIAIISVEQAEALPLGTIATSDEPFEDGFLAVLRSIKGQRVWESVDAGMRTDADMVGWVALRPTQSLSRQADRPAGQMLQGALQAAQQPAPLSRAS